MADAYTVKRVTELARIVDNDPKMIGVLSTGECCAVALLHNRADFLPAGYSFLDAVDRLEGNWIAACLEANRRNEWRQHSG